MSLSVWVWVDGHGYSQQQSPAASGRLLGVSPSQTLADQLGEPPLVLAGSLQAFRTAAMGSERGCFATEKYLYALKRLLCAVDQYTLAMESSGEQWRALVLKRSAGAVTNATSR